MAIGSLSQVLRQTLLRLRPTKPGTDGELLARFLSQRDQAAFAELVRRHGTMVLRVCRRILPHAVDVDDAFQATFIVLARKAGQLTHVETVGGWLHGVAYRIALNARKKHNQLHGREKPLEGDMVGRGAARRADWSVDLDDEIGRLPEKNRLPVVLCYREGKTNQEAVTNAFPLWTIFLASALPPVTMPTLDGSTTRNDAMVEARSAQ